MKMISILFGFPCSNSHPDYSSTENSFSPCHQWIPKFDCPSPINVGMTVSGALQILESTTSSPSSFGSSQNNNQGNSSGLSLTNNIEIPSVDLSEELFFKPIEQHQDHIQKQPEIVHPIPCQTSTHLITTRSKSGISKPKLYLTNTKPKSAFVLIENLEASHGLGI